MIPFPERYLLLIQSLSGELLSLEADYFALTYDSVPERYLSCLGSTLYLQK
jgi:hypothetical protein